MNVLRIPCFDLTNGKQNGWHCSATVNRDKPSVTIPENAKHFCSFVEGGSDVAHWSWFEPL